MASDKLDVAFPTEERGAFVREIFGILLAIFTLLIFLSLVSARPGSNWIGPVGMVIADSLFFVLGHIVAYALPIMLAVITFYAFRGSELKPTASGAWLRGIGGIVLLVCFCAFLTLCAAEGDREQAFAWGGTVGNFLVDAEGMGLGWRLGRVGAFITFGGLAMVGLVLFTATLVSDFSRLAWRLVQRMTTWRLHLSWPTWLRLPQWKFFDWIAETFAWVRLCWMACGRAWGRFVAWVRGIDFERQRASKVLPMGPIVELKPSARQRAFPIETPHKTETASAPVGAREIFGVGADDTDEEENDYSLEFDVAPPRKKVAPKRAKYAEEIDTALERAIDDSLLPPREAPAKPVQAEMELFPDEYQLPALTLLADPPEAQYEMSQEERERLSRKIEATLEEFKVQVEVVDVVQGPVITRFAMKVAPGVRVNKILALESELAMSLRAQHVRILAPIPGQAAVGIEVPNKKANPVMLRELLEDNEFRSCKAPLGFALGKGISGETVVCDLARMPHLLIAGATGSGKSVCLNTIIASLLFRNKPDEVRFVMIDPKRVELSIYQAIPHLVAPVVSEPKKAAAALAWCVDVMEQRYKLLAELGVRNLDGYNKIVASAHTGRPHPKAIGRDLKYMPHYVIIIDELADLMMVAKNEVEEYVIRLAQMARAVGMHLILATQRPSVNVITGLIKANFPSRIAFAVSSKVDSRTILDMNGAESLMGRGDMLYSPGGVKPFRIQGAFVSDAEIERLADMIRAQQTATYEKEDFEPEPTAAERAKAQLMGEALGGMGGGLSAAVHDANRPVMAEGDGYDGWDEDPDTNGGPGPMATRGLAGVAPLSQADLNSLTDEDLYEVALRLVLESKKGSVSYIQRRLKIGYARAGRLMDMMEERGIVGPYQGSKPRDLLVDPGEFLGE